MKNLFKNVNFSFEKFRGFGNLYNNFDSFTTEKYLSFSSGFEEMASRMEKRWEDFVCNFFGWDSYYVNPQIYNGTCLSDYPGKIKPLKKALDKISDWFDVKFEKGKMVLTNKKFETAVA